MGDPVGIADFGVFLSQVDAGTFLQELGEAQKKVLDELQRHAADRGKAKGELTISLAFSVDAAGVVEVLSDIKTKLPKADRPRSIFWVAKDGGLTNRNPKQVEMKFRDVSAVSAASEEAIGISGLGRARSV